MARTTQRPSIRSNSLGVMTSDSQPPSLPPRAERTFPTLTPEQIARVAACGRKRAIERGEVLVEAGQEHYPFFLVVDGQIEIVSSSALRERLVTTQGPGQFTGEVNMLTGRRGLATIRVLEAGQVIEVPRDALLNLVQTDGELGEGSIAIAFVHQVLHE